MPNNNLDKYLDPPDEPEAAYCENCGQEYEYHFENAENWYVCKNPFCPDKFISTTLYQGRLIVDMAEHLVQVEQDFGYANDRIANFQTKLARLEKLTQSQSKVVVRDTEYQIRRMEDAIECMHQFQDIESLAMIDKEWKEVKKILLQGE